MPPPGLGDLGIGDAGQPLLEFMGAAAAVDEVGVAIDEAGGGEAPLAVECAHGRPEPPRRGPTQAILSALDQDRRILDQAIAIPHRGGLEVGEQHDGSLLYKVVYTV